MTKFEYCIGKADECTSKAIYYLNRDVDLCIFYRNAAKGFIDRALNMSVAEGIKHVR